MLKQTLQDTLLWPPSLVALLRAPERRTNYESPEVKQEMPDVRRLFNHKEQTSADRTVKYRLCLDHALLPGTPQKEVQASLQGRCL